jgi:hypothetical protein
MQSAPSDHAREGKLRLASQDLVRPHFDCVLVRRAQQNLILDPRCKRIEAARRAKILCHVCRQAAYVGGALQFWFLRAIREIRS